MHKVFTTPFVASRVAVQRAGLALIFFGCCSLIQAQTAAQHLPTIQLKVGMHVMTVEVARTTQEHSIGLMFRRIMSTNDGMIFVFDEPGERCFWMKNTLLPLSAAFIADDGQITNIEEMQPQTLDSHCSTRKVRYVLEMNAQWFSKRGIKAGMKMQGQPFKP